MYLNWPSERVLDDSRSLAWYQPQCNLVLDFHGDPLKAKLVVFSDGNHHMALLPSLKAFYAANPELDDIFYATTPPGPLVAMMKAGGLHLGNLTLSITPHVFISPPHVLELLQSYGFVRSYMFMARNQGSVLLIQHGNPKGITGIQDLMRPDVRLFISHPDTESVSHQGYRKTLESMAVHQGISAWDFIEEVFGRTQVKGKRIHHREAPEAVASGSADAAIVYYHLAIYYNRIFPETFAIIPLGGTVDHPEPAPENQITEIHIGIVDNGGPWGMHFIDFMLSRAVADIYADHGLQHMLDIKHQKPRRRL
jgi:ABC-type molybdate transport system substrate-binding protein